MQSPEMPINQPIVVTNTDFIHVVATRTDAENILVVYRNPLNWDIVLDLHLTVSGTNSRVGYLDKVFWSVLVNGHPATEADYEDLGRKSNLNFVVEPQPRLVKVNMPTR